MKIKYLAFLFCLFVVTISCKSTNENTNAPGNAVGIETIDNPASAGEKKDGKEHVPVFSFAEEIFDFGAIEEGESVSHAFRFKNTGQGDLVIHSATGSCGCTIPEWSKDPIAPGKEGVINVTFNSVGKSGMQHKIVTIVANTIPNSKVLTVTGEVTKKK